MSINQKHFGLSDSLVNAVNEALHPNQKKLDVAEPKGKLDAKDFKKLRGEGAKPDFIDIDKDGNKTEPMKKASKEIKEDDAHFAQQSKKMQDAINMHLRKGKSYADAAKAAKVHVKEEVLDEKAVSQAQQKAAGAALATQRGEYAGGKKGGAVNRMALMKRAELEKIASTKRKGLPMRKEEVEEIDELSKDTLYSYGRKAHNQVVRTDVMGLAKRTGGVGVKNAALKIKNRKAGVELAYKKAQEEVEEGFVVKYHDDKGAYKNKSRVFTTKDKATAHANRGNSITRVGGKYTVHAIDAKGQDVKEEVEVTEADDAVSKQIAAKKDAMKKQIQQKIAQKQMSVLQQKAQKKIQTIKAGTEKCSCDSTNESKMKCEVHGDDKKLKGGKEPIEINPPLKEASDLPKSVITKGHEIAKSLIKSRAKVKEPYAVGMAQAKKSAGIKD